MKTFYLSVLTSALLITSVLAEGNSIRGTVTDAKGKPVAGAEIRAERTDAKGPAAAATTDAKGQYTLSHLAVGTYKLTAYVNKSAKSAATVKTTSAGWVKADFPLKDAFAKQHHDQSATDRTEGQDIRTMQQNQGFGVSTVPANVSGGGR